MVIRPLPLLSALIVLTATVAGCIGGDDPEVKVPVPAGNGGGDNNTTDPLGPLDAPVWTVGQWWAHHTYQGPEDKTGSHFNVVVVDDADGYTVASQSSQHAKMEAEQDVFDLGAFDADLSTTWFGADWRWYDWPLVDNKSWTQDVLVDGTPHTVELRASYAPELPTALGPGEGYKINGTLEDGTLIVSYDYVADMGWFSGFDLFDPSDPATTLFKVRNMGYGEGKTGDYVVVDIVEVVNETYTSTVAPATATLTVPAGTSTLTGTIRVEIEVGQATLTLTDPDGGASEYSTDPPGGTKETTLDESDPPAGDWSLNFVGIGNGGAATVALTAVVETIGTL